MLTPQQFIGLYGTPLIQEYHIISNATLRIPYDPSRYLLAFMRTSDSVWVTPTYPLEVSIAVPNFTPSTAPLIFNHALHGALVNLPWSVCYDGIDADVLVLVAIGIMRERTVNTRKRK